MPENLNTATATAAFCGQRCEVATPLGRGCSLEVCGMLATWMTSQTPGKALQAILRWLRWSHRWAPAQAGHVTEELQGTRSQCMNEEPRDMHGFPKLTSVKGQVFFPGHAHLVGICMLLIELAASSLENWQILRQKFSWTWSHEAERKDDLPAYTAWLQLGNMEGAPSIPFSISLDLEGAGEYNWNGLHWLCIFSGWFQQFPPSCLLPFVPMICKAVGNRTISKLRKDSFWEVNLF